MESHTSGKEIFWVTDNYLIKEKSDLLQSLHRWCSIHDGKNEGIYYQGESTKLKYYEKPQYFAFRGISCQNYAP